MPPSGGVRGYVRGSSMARWKARGQLPISANWTFVASYYGWGTITACTVVQAVVKANSQSNWERPHLTPWSTETPERISIKLGMYNRVADMATHANPCGAATTWVVGTNTWKKHMLWFLRYAFLNFFALFFGSRRARTSGPILTIYTLHDVFPPKDVPFGVAFILLPILG